MVDIQVISWNASGYSQLHRLTGGNLLTFFLTYLLAFFLTFILTLFLTVFLPYLVTFCLVLSDILLTFFLAYLLSFFLTYLLAFFWHILWYSFWHYFWHIRWHFVWHSFWHIFWHFFSHLISGLRSENNGQRRSQLRSGRHWAQMVTIEVRHGTLGSDGRGWGPTRSTQLRPGREHRTWLLGWGLAGNTGRDCSQLRSDGEHWTPLLAVEVRQGGRTGGAGGGRGGGGDWHKSNNPHLTGGEYCSLGQWHVLITCLLGGIFADWSDSPIQSICVWLLRPPSCWGYSFQLKESTSNDYMPQIAIFRVVESGWGWFWWDPSVPCEGTEQAVENRCIFRPPKGDRHSPSLHRPEILSVAQKGGFKTLKSPILKQSGITNQKLYTKHPWNLT